MLALLRSLYHKRRTLAPPKSALYQLLLLFLIHLSQLGCLVGCDAGVDDLFDISVHDLVSLIQGQTDTMVGDTTLGEVVGTDLLRTVSGTDLTAAHLCFRIVSLLLLDVIQLGL